MSLNAIAAQQCHEGPMVARKRGSLVVFVAAAQREKNQKHPVLYHAVARREVIERTNATAREGIIGRFTRWATNTDDQVPIVSAVARES